MANAKSIKTNEKKVVVELTKIKRSKTIENIEATAELRNGNVVKLGEYMYGDYFKGAVPSASDSISNDSLVFICAPFVPYDERENEEDYIIPVGERVRGYVLEEGERVTITKDGIEGNPVVGQFVVPQSGKNILKASATKSGATLNFEVIGTKNLHGYEAVILRVVR